MIIGMQESISPYSLNEISLLNTHKTPKWVKKQIKERDLRIEMSKEFDYSKHPWMVYIVEEHANLQAKLDMAIGFDSSSSMNSWDERLGSESLPFSHVCLIGDEAPKFGHVGCEEESLHDRIRLIGNQRLRYHHTSVEVHHAHLISVVITLQINGWD